MPMFFHPLMMYFLTLDPLWMCATNSTVCLLNGSFPSENTGRCAMPRGEWKYAEPAEYSIIAQFDIHCGKEWNIYLANSILFVSWCIGAMIGAWISDNYGGKIIILPSVVMTVVLGVCLAYSPTVAVFISFRLLIGFFVPGSSYQIFVMLSEFVTKEKRPLAIAHATTFIAVGEILFATKAYFVRNWRTYITICSAPYLVLIVCWCFIPESIYWLHEHGRKEELIKVLERVAYCNDRAIPSGLVISCNTDGDAGKRSNYFDILRPREVLMKTMVLGYTWMVIIMTFYALKLAANDLGGSIYLNFIFLALIQIPAYYLSVMCTTVVGGKRTMCGCMITGGMLCILIAFTPTSGEIKIARIIFGVAGNFFIVCGYCCIIVLSVELYPTHTRSQAIGVFQLMSRIGAASAPWIAKGLKYVYRDLPFFVLGGLSILAGLLMLILQETNGTDTISSTRNDVGNTDVSENRRTKELSSTNSMEESTCV